MKQERKQELMGKHTYSQMLGLQCDRKKEELIEEKKEYKEMLVEMNTFFSKAKSKLEFINSQIKSIDYALSEYYRIELQKIEPTEEHKKLLANMYFQGMWNGDLVSIGVDGKRPFGDSDMYGCVAKILKWELPNEDLSDEQRKRADRLLDELPYVLNKILNI